MRPFILRLSWPLVSFLSACIALPLGYALVWVTTFVVSILLFFLWIIGALIGLCLGVGLGGALIGWITGQTQQFMLGEHQPPSQRLRTISTIIWAIAGLFCLQALLPVSSGDMAPLVPILVCFALLASGIQWLVLIAYRVPGSFWWGSGGMLGITSGTLTGILVLGAIYGRVPSEVLAGLNRSYESIASVQVTRLVEFNHKVAIFIAIEETNRTNRWELWMSDGTIQGTTHIETSYAGGSDANVSEPIIKENQLYFRALGTEDPADAQSYKNRLTWWVTDGTPAGSHPWPDLLSGGSEAHSTAWNQEPLELSIEGTTYFVIQKDKRNIEVWRRDSVSGQEVLVKKAP